MWRFVALRAVWLVALLVLVSTLTFVIFNLMPSADPVTLRAGKAPTPAVIAEIRHQLRLDRPVIDQYKQFMDRLLFHFDLGKSYTYNEPVRKLIFSRLGASVSLALGAAIVWLTVGISVGVISAIRRRTVLDRMVMFTSLAAISAPVYWLGLMMLYLFSRDIGAFPICPGASSYVPVAQDPGMWFASLVMPWFVLAAAFAAIYARYVRAGMTEVMSEDYIRTARAKGLREHRVVLAHGLRSAITPVVTILGIDLGVLLGGAVLIETVFNIPGLGRLAYDAITRADLPVIQGTVIVSAFFIIAMNFFVDVAYAVIDPRVRRQA